jgi:hypothetical protein
MKKNIIIAIMLIIIALPLSAQPTKDVLYLKNGSKIYGRLLEVNDTLYKIKTYEGSLFVFSKPEVEKFVNEAYVFEGRKKGGPGFVLEAGFLAGVKSTEYSTPFSFNMLVNTTLSMINLIGIGTGVEYTDQAYIPLFLEYKLLTSTNKTTPFFFIRGGKMFHKNGDLQSSDITPNPYNYEKNYKGGSSFTLGTGISWANEGHETYLSFAYRNIHTSYTQKNYNKLTDTYNSTLNRLEVKLGFRF